MGISISCSPGKAFVDCRTQVRVIVKDPSPNNSCIYTLRWRFPRGMQNKFLDRGKSLITFTGPLNSGSTAVVFWVLPNREYLFLVEANPKPGTITLKAEKYCPSGGQSYTFEIVDPKNHHAGTDLPVTLLAGDLIDTDLKDFEILECNDKNAKGAGIGAGIATTGLGLTIAAGSKIGGGVGSVGGPLGIGIGILAGIAVGLVVHAVMKPDCCPSPAAIPQTSNAQGKPNP